MSSFDWIRIETGVERLTVVNGLTEHEAVYHALLGVLKYLRPTGLIARWMIPCMWAASSASLSPEVEPVRMNSPLQRDRASAQQLTRSHARVDSDRYFENTTHSPRTLT